MHLRFSKYMALNQKLMETLSPKLFYCHLLKQKLTLLFSQPAGNDAEDFVLFAHTWAYHKTAQFQAVNFPLHPDIPQDCLI